MSDGGATIRAEEAPDGLSRGALALPLLDGAVDSELVLGDDGDEGWLLCVSRWSIGARIG